MAGPLKLRFVQSAAKHSQLPDSVLEVAVVGRSNVGKSSLLNALAHRKSLAKTSKTPGATRLLNVYEHDPEGSGRWLVDLPGYGYARAPKHELERWARMIEAYLTERENLKLALVLIDGVVGPTALDVQTLEWFDHIGVPVVVVATKADKVKSSTIGARRAELARKCEMDPSDVYWVSAAKGTGIPELRDDVRNMLEVG